MKVTDKSLARLETDFAGYIEGDKIDELFAENRGGRLAPPPSRSNAASVSGAA